MNTKTAIKDMLTGKSFPAVVTTQQAAELLNISPRTLNKQKNEGSLRYMERNAISLDAIVDWLYANPHFQTKLNRR